MFAGVYKAYEQRNINARRFPSTTTERIIGMFLPHSMFEASIGGVGIGIGTTGAAAVLTGERAFTLAEGDLDRNFSNLVCLLVGFSWPYVGRLRSGSCG